MCYIDISIYKHTHIYSSTYILTEIGSVYLPKYIYLFTKSTYNANLSCLAEGSKDSNAFAKKICLSFYWTDPDPEQNRTKQGPRALRTV